MIEWDEFGPEKVLEVYDPVMGMHGFLVIDNTALGPGKGGIRMTSSVTVQEVFRLARTMTWKNALAKIPFGGAKSGIVAEPREITAETRKALIQSFARAIKPLSPSLYIAGPDVGTGQEDMRWYAEANGSLKSCTGKPAEMCVKPGEECGIPHEFGSTGFGVVHSAAETISFLGLNIKDITVAIEGFGNVGSFVARHISVLGARVVAVSDRKGTVYNEAGLEIETLIKRKEATGSVTNYKPGTVLPTKELFELKVDILIPAALSDVITSENVNKIKARLIVEGSNIPMTPNMEEILHKKGILVVPDLVANAGGVISSYAEYRGYNPKKMFEMVERKIKNNTRTVLEHARSKGIKPRDAAMEIAVERVRKATRLRRERLEAAHVRG
ncbi:MAG TPA: Glu/Leu/Phe/Val family dehydrogenase [Candidatus Hypogeohydataceae bacterium YC41]